MSDKPIWFCSISLGMPYTAIKISHPTWPTVTFGKHRAVRYASCSIQQNDQPTYQRMQIDFEDATGIALPPMKREPHYDEPNRR